MDLNLGVFDVKGDAPTDVPVVEGEAWTKGEEDSDSDSDSSGTSSDEEEQEEDMIKEVKTTTKKD